MPTEEIKLSVKPKKKGFVTFGRIPDVELNLGDSIRYMKDGDRTGMFSGKEKEFQTWIEENIAEVLEILGIVPKTIQSQKCLKVGSGRNAIRVILDLIVHDVNGGIHVFEIKKSNSKYPCTATVNQCNAIGQMLLYHSFVEAFYGIKPMLYLVDDKIFVRTAMVFANHHLPIVLLELRADRLAVIQLSPGVN